jgi:hypothetical protein
LLNHLLAAAERVCSRACHHLHLPRTASDLRIHRRGDDTNLFDQIGARIRAGQRAIVVPPVSDVEAVSRHIHGAKPSSGKIAVKVVFSRACAAGRREQIHHIAAAQGQVAHLVIRKHGSYRRRRRRDQCVRSYADLNRLRHRTDLKREVQPHLLRNPELDPAARLALKAGQLRAHAVRSSL